MSKSSDRNYPTFSFKAEDHDVNMWMVKSASRSAPIRGLKVAFEFGQLFYEDQMVKAVMMNIVSKL